MIRLCLICLLFISLPLGAFATVKPPVEWFDSPEKIRQWEEFAPTLENWEFEEQPPLFGPPNDRLQGIKDHLGQTTAELAQDLGIAKDSPDLLRYDTNRDGLVNHFDVLALGYEVRPASKSPSIAPSSGTNQWCVIRADFPDQHADYGTYDEQYFIDRFFAEAAPKPSVHEYFNEVSYGDLSIDGSIGTNGPEGDGWYEADNNKGWYQTNGGRYLVSEMIYKADDEFDYSDFDVDGDGYVDTLIVFYPNTVFNNGLHPHRSSGLNIHLDGVIIDSYFLSGYNTGNDSWTMTISAHEYGHILGLPDLYDTNGGSQGIGKWGLMAYQYDNNHLVPSPSPWCKIQLGWVTPTIIRNNVVDYELAAYENGRNVLKVWTNGQREDQYFLISNLRKTGTDASRPGQGLMIWHIDDSRTGNTNENRKLVDVESARGFDDPDSPTGSDPLDAETDLGNSQDPFYSGNSHANYTGEFSSSSNPHSKSYPHPWSETYVRVYDIPASADTMTFSIEVESPDRPDCAITSPEDGTGATGNVTVNVDATANGGRSIARVDFFFNGAFFGSDSTSPYSLTLDSRPVYDGNREITAVAVDSAGEEASDTITVNVSNDAATGIGFEEDFEDGIGAWAPYDEGGFRRWGASTTAYEGSLSAGIGNSNGYDYNEHDSLVGIKLDLTTATDPVLKFRQRYRVANGENTCKVLATTDEGTSLDLLQVYTGTNLEWHPAAVPLAAYAGGEVRLIFKLEGSSLNRISGTEGGWWIDAIEIAEYTDPPEITAITPGDTSELSGAQTITVTATDDVGITAVDFIIDGDDYIFIDYESPFEFDWNSDWVFNGSHTFTAIAFDGDLQSDSMTVNWTTSNDGQPAPYGNSFDDDPYPEWRITDDSGGGNWHQLNTGGYDDGPFMRFCIPDQDVYDDLENDIFLSPTIDLTGTPDGSVRFTHKYDIEAGWDYAYVFITTDLSTWDQLASFSAYNIGWAQQNIDISAYADEKVKLAWYFYSDVLVTADGWWVDAVQIGGKPVITGSDPTEAVNGQEVSILGHGLGNSEHQGQHSITVGGVSPTIVSWDVDEVVIEVPADIGSSNVVVNAYGLDSDPYALTIKLPPPELDDLGRLQ